MWQSNILSFSNTLGVLMVMVQYTNGTNSFNESTNMSGWTEDFMNQYIQNRLNVLNSNDTLVESISPKISAGFTILTAMPVQVALPVANPVSLPSVAGV